MNAARARGGRGAPAAAPCGARDLRAVALAALAVGCATLGCVTTPAATEPRARASTPAVPPALLHAPLDVRGVRVAPEPITVEDAWILDLYTWLHRRDYGTFRVELPPAELVVAPASAAPAADAAPGHAQRAAPTSAPRIAHLLVPPGPGPHPTVVVYPILAGSHVVSEALAKAIVRRGYLVAWLERDSLLIEEAESAEEIAESLRSSLLQGRRLLDYLETRPDVDKDRIAAAGVSLGGVLACLLHGVDDRIRAGAYLMTGGGLPEIIADSSEVPVRIFREKIMEREDLDDPAAFADYLRKTMETVDPLTYAGRIDPRSVWMLSTRFDRVIRPIHADALHAALGEPTRVEVPAGHYQVIPFFWWGVARAVDHLDHVFDVGERSAESAQE